jgi:hypothetical protein
MQSHDQIGISMSLADQISRLADGLYRERVLEARAMAPEDKLLAGEELFEYACSTKDAHDQARFQRRRTA